MIDPDIKVEYLENGTVRVYPYPGNENVRIWIGKRAGHRAEVHWPTPGVHATADVTEQFIAALQVSVSEARKIDQAAKDKNG